MSPQETPSRRSSPQTSRFETLPAELRAMIFESLAHSILQTPHSTLDTSAPIIQQVHSVLSTSHRFRSEALVPIHQSLKREIARLNACLGPDDEGRISYIRLSRYEYIMRFPVRYRKGVRAVEQCDLDYDRWVGLQELERQLDRMVLHLNASVLGSEEGTMAAAMGHSAWSLRTLAAV